LQVVFQVMKNTLRDGAIYFGIEAQSGTPRSIPLRKWNGFLRGLPCLRVTETTKESGELSHIKKNWRNPMLFQDREEDWMMNFCY